MRPSLTRTWMTSFSIFSPRSPRRRRFWPRPPCTAPEVCTLLIDSIPDRTVQFSQGQLGGHVTKGAESGSRLSEARRDDIVETAWSLFLAQGYSGASMAEISERLGGSKATLYNYFASKDLLFQEVIARKGSALYARLNQIPSDLSNLHCGLTEFGVRLLRVVLSNEYISVHR